MNNNKLSQRLNSFPKDHQLNQDTKEKIKHVLQAEVRREKKKVEWKGLKGFIKKTKIPVAVTTAAILFSFLLLTVKSFDFSQTEDNKNSVDDPDTELPAEQPEMDKSEEDKDQDKLKEEKEQVSPRLKAITKTLSDFELPKDNRITGERKKELVGNYSNFDKLIVYKSGYVLNKDNKAIESRIYFNDKPPKATGTIALAYFRTLLLKEISNHTNLQGEHRVDDEKMTITEKDRTIMENFLKNDDPNTQSVQGWDAVETDINSKLKRLNSVEGQLQEYEDLYDWINEAKSYFKKAKEIGVKDWEKAYRKYIKGAKFVDELKHAMNQ
ncbi:hypothetical protein [Virgibacillus litoralis]|uniref:Lysozyme inhibitor LprI N-terminal domain-containing protein n=1 Tax=Virgibacillus litoralis TaxID=578221 RepID=A0ABS4H8H5_9BACI|nr:hypothetical protein [Virgibacillus litoralis]MBP1947206.1 hypothetical protein [Virgibacillus litoralis]